MEEASRKYRKSRKNTDPEIKPVIGIKRKNITKITHNQKRKANTSSAHKININIEPNKYKNKFKRKSINNKSSSSRNINQMRQNPLTLLGSLGPCKERMDGEIFGEKGEARQIYWSGQCCCGGTYTSIDRRSEERVLLQLLQQIHFGRRI